jgi:glycosyltransferase involved in cell wall biosynthesis
MTEPGADGPGHHTRCADLRVVAVVTVRNEERFIAACLENLIEQGLQVYLCDNDSTDRTHEIAEQYLGAGLIAIERVPYHGTFDWQGLLRRKEELFQSLDADWLMHVDADEIFLSPSQTPLASAITAVDALGYEAIDFFEFTFVPSREDPEHDTPAYQTTLRTYYPFRPRAPYCVRAFKKQPGPMEIAWSGGHVVRFDHPVRLHPEPFRKKHYLFLSVEQARSKYLGRNYRSDEVASFGWHGWRARLQAKDIWLPSACDLRVTAGDDDLDASNPWTRHWLDSHCVP